MTPRTLRRPANVKCHSMGCRSSCRYHHQGVSSQQVSGGRTYQTICQKRSRCVVGHGALTRRGKEHAPRLPRLLGDPGKGFGCPRNADRQSPRRHGSITMADRNLGGLKIQSSGHGTSPPHRYVIGVSQGHGNRLDNSKCHIMGCRSSCCDHCQPPRTP